jgi:hypothetical protein
MKIEKGEMSPSKGVVVEKSKYLWTGTQSSTSPSHLSTVQTNEVCTVCKRTPSPNDHSSNPPTPTPKNELQMPPT